MADTTFTLPAVSFSFGSTQRRWVFGNNRPSIPAALRSDPNTALFIRVVNFRADRNTLFLNFTTSSSSENRGDMSDAFETGGTVQISHSGASFRFSVTDDEVALDQEQDPYGYTFTGTKAAEFQAFRATLVSPVPVCTAVLWDGLGDSPFPDVPSSDVPVRASSLDFSLDSANSNPISMAFRNGIMYALDEFDSLAYAYELTDSGATYRSAQNLTAPTVGNTQLMSALGFFGNAAYFGRLNRMASVDLSDATVTNLTLDSSNTQAIGIDFLDNIAYVLDASKVFAYRVTSQGFSRLSGRDFSLNSRNANATDIAIYGSTAYIGGFGDTRVFAYDLASDGAAYSSSKSIQSSRTILAVGIAGRNLYVADSTQALAWQLPELPDEGMPFLLGGQSHAKIYLGGQLQTKWYLMDRVVYQHSS